MKIMNIRLFSKAVVLFVSLLVSHAGIALGEMSFSWLNQFGTNAQEMDGRVAADSMGNVYIVGNTGGTLPGQTAFGGTDAYIRKYDALGNELWTRQCGTTANDRAFGVTRDHEENVYVVGYTLGIFPGQTQSGYIDAFIKKYDNNGNELWTRQFGTSEDAVAYGVAVDGNGNVYAVGKTWGVFPGQTSSGEMDAFIRKYDGLGNEIWTRQFGTSLSDIGMDIATDQTGKIYVAGTEGDDIFIRKFDGAGQQLWARQFGTSAEDIAYGITVDNSGYAFIAGATSGSFPGQGSSGGKDAFICKYNQAGAKLWVRQFGTNLDDDAFAITTDNMDHLYIVGYTMGAFPGETSSGSIDAFLGAYDTSGNALWVNQFGSSSYDYAYDVAVDGLGNVFIGGTTGGTLPGQTSSGDVDAFIAKK